MKAIVKKLTKEEFDIVYNKYYKIYWDYDYYLFYYNQRDKIVNVECANAGHVYFGLKYHQIDGTQNYFEEDLILEREIKLRLLNESKI
ncbi:MAG: hypothetical protein ABSG25_07125 [Bryobacteraceae bacterium]